MTRSHCRWIDAPLGTTPSSGVFLQTLAFTGTAQYEFRYDNIGGNTIIQFDFDGNASVDMEIELRGTYTLGFGDIFG